MNSRRRYKRRPSIKYAFFRRFFGFLALFCAWLLLLRRGSLGSLQNMAVFCAGLDVALIAFFAAFLVVFLRLNGCEYHSKFA